MYSFWTMRVARQGSDWGNGGREYIGICRNPYDQSSRFGSRPFFDGWFEAVRESVKAEAGPGESGAPEVRGRQRSNGSTSCARNVPEVLFERVGEV